MTRYLVTGASGLLGLNFAMHLQDRADVIGIVHHSTLVGVPFPTLSVDLTEPGQAKTLLEYTRPDIVIHCAAQANIDTCEKNPALAKKINAQVPGILAKETAHLGISMVHISTDSVFDGLQGGYTEESIPNPISVYSRSKLDGEHAVEKANPQALIARVNFYGFSLTGQRSLSEFFINNLMNGKKVNGYTDVYFNPLWVNHLVEVLLEMTEKNLHGLYHVLGSEGISKFEFGVKLARMFGLDESLIRPVQYMDTRQDLLAPRSPDLRCSIEKLKRDLGHDLPDIDTGLQGYFNQFQQGYHQQMQSFSAEVR
ncbi:MAG: SDR family oxidoreductase [Anaerolineaceae bacterium]|nr:SDR family oxidoreductase [Anaerolineaceae bacterium]